MAGGALRGTLLCVGAVLFLGCQDTRDFALTEEDRDCIDEFREGVDYFPMKSEREFAHLFELSYHDSYKRLAVRFPAMDGDTVTAIREIFVLVPCGAPTPSLEGDLARAIVVPTPARTVSVTTNEDLGMVVRLGFMDGVRSIGIRAIYPKEILDRYRNGAIADGGGWGSEGPHIETLMDLDPDLILMGVFGGAGDSHAPRLREVGLHAIPTMIRVEPTPLGRAEWVKVLGAFFHREAEANALFDEVKDDYLELSALARAQPQRPSAFWASTYAPGEWAGGRNSFQARFLEDAGAENVLADDGIPATVRLLPEEVLDLAGDADFWVTENTFLVREGVLTVRATPVEAIRAFREGRTYHLAARYRAESEASDYNYSGPGRPDLVLRDLVSLFHPDLVPGHTLHFLAPMESLR